MKGDKYTIPGFISNMESQGAIIVNRCVDYGPITKIIPTLDRETGSDTYIITFDDDHIIDRTAVHLFVKRIEKYPNAALSMSGWNLGTMPFLLEKIADNREDVDVDWIQGCNGIVYPPNIIIRDELLNFMKDYFKDTHQHDDHRISAYLEWKGVRKISIGVDVDKIFKTQDHCRLDAISKAGGFEKEVLFIALYLGKIGLYHRSYSILRSAVLKRVLIVILIIAAVIYAVQRIRRYV
jgi:mRNA-degrading endonuclease YafQ of YafQ-DinJ toxin-antitoxin module